MSIKANSICWHVANARRMALVRWRDERLKAVQSGSWWRVGYFMGFILLHWALKGSEICTRVPFIKLPDRPRRHAPPRTAKENIHTYTLLFNYNNIFLFLWLPVSVLAETFSRNVFCILTIPASSPVIFSRTLITAKRFFPLFGSLSLSLSLSLCL